MKISVITAVFNNKQFIEDAIRSVLSQTGVVVEYIVIDGGSTDGTLDVIDKYRDKIDIFHTGKDGGIYEALNRGLSVATGDFIGYLHSDDMFSSDVALSTLFQDVDSHVDLVYGDLDFVSRENVMCTVRRWKSSVFMPKGLRRGWMPPHPSFYARRDLMLSVGGFDTQFRISSDYDLIIKLFLIKHIRALYVPAVIVKMRVGGASHNSLQNTWRKFLENKRILDLHGFSGVTVAAIKIIRKLHQFFPIFISREKS